MKRLGAIVAAGGFLLLVPRLVLAQCEGGATLALVGTVCEVGVPCEVVVNVDDGGVIGIASVVATLAGADAFSCTDTCKAGWGAPEGTCMVNAEKCRFSVADLEAPITAFANGTVAELTVVCQVAGTYELAFADLSFGDPVGYPASGCGSGAKLVCEPSACASGDCAAPSVCDSNAVLSDACRWPGQSRLQVLDNGTDGRDRLLWKWRRGDATGIGDFGTPTADTDYTLCVYDYAGDVPIVVMELSVPPGGSWRDAGSKGFAYRNRSAVPDGVKKIRLAPGASGRAAITLQAKGAKLPMPAVSGASSRLFSQEPRLAARLYASSGACWGAEYYPTHVRAHTRARFDAETP